MMLGVSLLYVGIVLIHNGICTLKQADGQSAAVLNLLIGGLSVFINGVSLALGNAYAARTGLLFGFTYLFVEANQLLNLTLVLFACPLIAQGIQFLVLIL